MLLDRNREGKDRLGYPLPVSRECPVRLDDDRPIRSQHAHFEWVQRHPVDAQVPEAQEARVPHVEPGRALTVAVDRVLADEVQLIVLEHEFVMQHLGRSLAVRGIRG